MSISIVRNTVQVEILRDTAALSRVSFGVPLFIGTTDEGVRAAAYSNLAEVGAVYSTSDPEYLAATTFFAQSPQPRRLVIGLQESGETLVQALAAIRAVNDEWFAVAVEENDLDTSAATALADAVSALPGLRQLHLRSDDADILSGTSTTDLAVVLRDAGYDQARVVYHTLANTAFPEMAILGRVLPIPESRTSGPGSAPWHKQPITGIPGDSFTDSEIEVMDARDGTGKNADYIVNIAGEPRALGGKMAGGEYGDVMHGLAWLETRLAEDVFEILARAANRREKVPYNDEGISRIEGAVANRLRQAVDAGFIEPDFTVTAPLREETSFGDRANRLLRDVRFEANLTGAIKFVNIQGVVTA